MNYPMGCQAIIVCNHCLYDQSAKTKERNKTYAELTKLVEDGFLEKPYEGFYRPKEITDRRRYYLHSRIKKYYNVVALERRVDYTEGKQTPDRIKRHIKELMTIGYNIQHTIS